MPAGRNFHRLDAVVNRGRKSPLLLMSGYANTAAQAPPIISGNAEPKAPSPQAEAFYAEVLRELKRSDQPVLLAGTFALCAYTGITRRTKDLDVFCRAGDFPRILGH